MLAITTTYFGTTGRMQAKNDGRRVYIWADVNAPGKPDPMTTDEWCHWQAAQAFIEKHLSVRDRRLIGGWTNASTMVWCFADSPAQMEHGS
jgi:hypothetical protein